MATNTDAVPAAGSSSRRKLLTGLAAGAGVVVAETLVQGRPALAGNDGDVVLGQTNNETSSTLIINSTPGSIGLVAVAAGAGKGLYGSGGAGSGVYGEGGSIGVEGTGAIGTSGGHGVKGEVFDSPTSNGVYGHAENPDGSGVYGQNDGAGFGVAGRAANGTGVLADSSNGTALAVSGRATFTRSGKVNIAYPNKTAVVSVPGGLAASALALATVQDTTGVYVKSAVPNTSNGTLQINLNKAPGSGTNPKTAHVAWFVVN